MHVIHQDSRDFFRSVVHGKSELETLFVSNSVLAMLHAPPQGLTLEVAAVLDEPVNAFPSLSNMRKVLGADAEPSQVVDEFSRRKSVVKYELLNQQLRSLQGDYGLIVMYISKNALVEGVSTCRFLHQRYPDAKILGVVCCCGSEDRRLALGQLMSEHITAHIDYESECGGCRRMSDLSETLFDVWRSPTRRSTT